MAGAATVPKGAGEVKLRTTLVSSLAPFHQPQSPHHASIRNASALSAPRVALLYNMEHISFVFRVKITHICPSAPDV